MSKKKKEKIIYYDDNSTIVDMSNVTRNGKKRPTIPSKKASTNREKWQTYWSTVKMMLLPMGVVLCILALLYVLIIVFTGKIG